MGNDTLMDEREVRELMCEIGRRIYNKGFAAASDGNISYKLAEDRVLCTPTRISKGFMKPDDLCVIDLDGKQVSGQRKRSSEILLHLNIMKARDDVHSVVHCHPPHATAFAVAQEPIPKCILPEFEIFLGEVAISPYETPGTQKFADTVLPYVKDTETILLANHGTVTYGTDLEDAYFKTEIIDAYCRILLLAKQLGRVNYYDDQKAAELIRLKPGMNIPDPRLTRGIENCDLCGYSLFRQGYGDFSPEPRVFIHPKLLGKGEPAAGGIAGSVPFEPAPPTVRPSSPATSTTIGNSQAHEPDVESLVRIITEQVLYALKGVK